MNLVKCKIGHYFDCDEYEQCPVCGADRAEIKQSAQKINLVMCKNGHYFNANIYQQCPYCTPDDTAPSDVWKERLQEKLREERLRQERLQRERLWKERLEEERLPQERLRKEREREIELALREARRRSREAQISMQPMDSHDAASLTEFSINLLKQAIAEADGKAAQNICLSPITVFMVLGMTACGASKNTLSQMEQAFGMTRERLESMMMAYDSGIKSEKSYSMDKVFSMAKSVWINQNPELNVQLKESFLKKMSEKFEAVFYRENFSDGAVTDKINQWTCEKTKGMIQKLLDEPLSPNTMICLISTAVFEGKWHRPYEESSVKASEFIREDGKKRQIEMMYSMESRYLNGFGLEGFLRSYDGYRYVFAAFVPEKELKGRRSVLPFLRRNTKGIRQYAEELTAQKLLSLIENTEDADVHAGIPKFKMDCEYNKELIKKLGITDAFLRDKADFSEMTDHGFYIDTFIHKTHITVDEKGTQAAAAAAVVTGLTAIPPWAKEEKYVYLDRPFIYLIWDTKNKIPVFMGVVEDIAD